MTGYVAFWEQDNAKRWCVGLFKTLEAAQAACNGRGGVNYIWDRHDSHGLSWTTRKDSMWDILALFPPAQRRSYSIEAYEVWDEEAKLAMPKAGDKALKDDLERANAEIARLLNACAEANRKIETLREAARSVRRLLE